MRLPLIAFAVCSLLPLAAQAQQISAIWKNNCASCHGPRAEGGDGAQSLLDESLRHQDTDRRFFAAIRSGTINGKVVAPHAFGEGSKANLDNTRVWGLVNFLRELQAQDSRRRTGSSKPSEQGIYSTSRASFTIETVMDDLDTPWSMEFVPATSPSPLAGFVLATERPGSIKGRVLGKDNSEVLDVRGLPGVRNSGQGGLMDIALHPNFNENGWVYLSFADKAKSAGSGMTKVVRGKLAMENEGGATKRVLRWTDERSIFEARQEHYLGGGVHFGSKFAFDPKEPSILFFAIGERGEQEMAQDLTRPNGKVHRVKDDGSIPKDNPFVGRSGVYESIWSFGHRNPQGLCFDLAGNLWDTEHAPRGGDELNVVSRGRNYGWPLVSFGINYSGTAFRTPWPETTPDFPASVKADDIEMPKDRWLPSTGACGLCVVNAPEESDPFHAWHGDLLAGGLAGQNVDRIRLDGTRVVEREEVLHGLGRVRDIKMGPEGAIYVVLNNPGKVVRLKAERAK